MSAEPTKIRKRATNKGHYQATCEQIQTNRQQQVVDENVLDDHRQLTIRSRYYLNLFTNNLILTLGGCFPNDAPLHTFSHLVSRKPRIGEHFL
ncbi:hypothetical protein TNIN_385781 [Trichonephila inaurata madagascariensis]|uniref:Uncharacterized protein n=1 Tax=Trichonephila inaurata madagascariensis TaxID=2747483 RepID=A0A8X6YIE5_9ARAC|nr:hypothetical protein TNIN_385781 [Trichonephila inaurata madagascariensis]